VIVPTPAPVAKKKSPLIPILIAAVAGAAIAGGMWWKSTQTDPHPAVIINPPINGGTPTPVPKKESSTIPTGLKTTPGIAQPFDKPHTPVANQLQANLVVLCNLDCAWTLDGQPQGTLAAGRPVSVKVPLGTHMVTASSVDGADSDDITVNAAATTQTVPARMDLLTKRNQRLQASAQAQAAQAAQQRQQQIQQQIQAQQAAQAQRIQPQQQQQAANAQQLTPAITSPCQIPAMPLIWH